MNSTRLRYFITVVETESIRKAAEVLHISAAALSKAIKQFEHEIGTTLLIPSGRGIYITREGKQLVQQTKPILQELDKVCFGFKQNIRSGQPPINPIRIGSFEIFTTHFLRKILQIIPPDKEVILLETIPGEMEIKLRDFQIDYGITYMPVATSNIEHKKISNIEMNIFGLKNIFESLPFEKLPFVSTIDPILEVSNQIKYIDGWPFENIGRHVKYRVDLLESALELARQGKAVAYLPNFLVDIHNETTKSLYNLNRLPLPKGCQPYKHAIYIAKRKLDSHDELLDDFIKIIKKYCK